jgi:hypothetical protein
MSEDTMPTKKNYHKPPEDPVGGGLKEKGREGIVMSPSMGTFWGISVRLPDPRISDFAHPSRWTPKSLR